MRNINKLYLAPGSTFVNNGKKAAGDKFVDLVDEAFYYLTGLRLPLSNCEGDTPLHGQVITWDNVNKKLIFTTVLGITGGTDLSGVKTANSITINSSTGAGYTIPLATTTTSGLLSPNQVIKLNNLSGINTGDVTKLDTNSIKINLTGQQISATLNGIDTAIVGQIPVKGLNNSLSWTDVAQSPYVSQEQTTTKNQTTLNLDLELQGGKVYHIYNNGVLLQPSTLIIYEDYIETEELAEGWVYIQKIN